MRDEEKVVSLLRAGEVLVLTDRFDEAEELYLSLQESSAYHSLMGRALVANKRGEPKRVVELTSAALELQHGDVEALLSRGHAKLELGDPQAAFEDFTSACGDAPESAMGAYSLGLSLARLGRFDEAEPLLKVAVQKDAEVVRFGLALARVQLQLKKIAEAIDTLRGMVENAPDRPEAYLELASILSAAGEDEAAHGVLDTAAHLAEIEDPGLLHELARLSVVLELKEAALSAIDRLDKVVEETPEGLCEMAGLAMAARSIEDAIAYVDRALKLDGGYGPGYYLLGVCLDAIKDSEQAEKAYRLAIQLAPQDWRGPNNLAALLLDREDDGLLDEISKLLLQAEKVSQATRPEILMNKALYERSQGNGETADLLLRTVLEMTGSGSALRERASIALMSLRDYKLH